MSERIPQKMGKVIQIDENQINQLLGALVCGTVEETLNKLLDKVLPHFRGAKLEYLY